MKGIKRSTGIHPGVPWAGPLPGGGYSGITPDLDRAVERAAVWLRKVTGKNIQIRFNSNRWSGGAFLACGSFDNDLGITASMRGRNVRGRRIPVRPIWFAVLAKGKFTKESNTETSIGPYFYKGVKTLAEAKQIFRRVAKLRLNDG